MHLEAIWNKLEDEEALSTREEKQFSDGLEQGIDQLGQLFDEQGKD